MPDDTPVVKLGPGGETRLVPDPDRPGKLNVEHGPDPQCCHTCPACGQQISSVSR